VANAHPEPVKRIGELIVLELSRGRNTMGTWQDLVEGTGIPAAIRVFGDSYSSCAPQLFLKRE
jgi:hypothetical protein